MVQGRRRALVLASLLALLLCTASSVSAQDRRYSIALRSVELSQAIELFVDLTGAAVVFDPSLAEGHRTLCVARERTDEEVLGCILNGTGLDYVRLSSGTFALVRRAELPALYGHVSGEVRERDSGRPVVDAHVVVAGLGPGVATNAAGYFVLPPLLPGPYVLRVSHVGYEAAQDSVQVQGGARVRLEIPLQSHPIAIEPVVVDGSAHVRLSDGLASGVVTFGDSLSRPDEIPARGALGAVQALAGVRVSDVTADVHVQGAASGAHELRLDGVPIYLPASLVGIVGPFAASALERIVVHRAGYGVAEGSLTAGVVLAEQATATGRRFDLQADPLSVSARAEGAAMLPGGRRLTSAVAVRSSLGTLQMAPGVRAHLQAASVPDPFLLVAPLRHYAAAEPSLIGSQSGLMARPDPQIGFLDLHASTRLRLGPLSSVYASAYQGRQTIGGDLVDEADLPEEARLTLADRYRWQNRALQVRYSGVWGRRLLGSVQLRHSAYRMAHHFLFLENLPLGGPPGGPQDWLDATRVRAHDGNAVQEWSAAGSLDYVASGHQVEAGAEATLLRSDVDLFRAVQADPTHAFVTAGVPAAQRHRSLRVAAYASDEVSLGRSARAEVGLRLTYLAETGRLYAEPRADLRYDAETGLLGRWSGRTAAGLYRQFVSRHDFSQLDAGALLPSVRLWLPVDASVRPPLAFHLVQAFVVHPGERVRIAWEGFVRAQPHGLVVDPHASSFGSAPAGAPRQREFLVAARSRTTGSILEGRWAGRSVQVLARYEYTRTWRESAALFGGRRESVPWNVPHLALAEAFFTPHEGLLFGLRWRGLWGRRWGFRPAYYDYFGHHDALRTHGPFDFGHPSDHGLPPDLQLDLVSALSCEVGRAHLQLRIEVLNVLNRANADHWRVIYDGGMLQRTMQTRHPVLPTIALRLGF